MQVASCKLPTYGVTFMSCCTKADVAMVALSAYGTCKEVLFNGEHASYDMTVALTL
jgi:hypothetical protein